MINSKTGNSGGCNRQVGEFHGALAARYLDLNRVRGERTLVRAIEECESIIVNPERDSATNDGVGRHVCRARNWSAAQISSEFCVGKLIYVSSAAGSSRIEEEIVTAIRSCSINVSLG